MGTPVPSDGHSGSLPDALRHHMAVRSWRWSHSHATGALPGARVWKALPAYHICSAFQVPRAT